MTKESFANSHSDEVEPVKAVGELLCGGPGDFDVLVLLGGTDALGVRDTLVGGDVTVDESDDAVAITRETLVVCDHDDGGTLLVEAGEDGHDLFAGVGVEVTGGFVGEDEFGSVGQGACDGDALDLSAREFAGAVIESASDAHGGGGDASAFGPDGTRDATVDEGERDVFGSGGVSQEVEGLKDEADATIADSGEVAVVETGDGLTGEGVGSAVGSVQSAQQVHEGAFSGAAGAHDGDELSATDVEVDVVEGDDLIIALAEDPAQSTDANQDVVVMCLR